MGEKLIEVRSKLPLSFDKSKDVVFVVQKGTKTIPIYFTVTIFSWAYGKFTDFKSIAKDAAVSTDFMEKYWADKKSIYVWTIGCVCRVDNPCYLYSELKIVKNPQSFIYRDYEWRQIEFTSFKWLTKPKNTLKPIIEYLRYKRYMRSLSSAKPSTL